MPNSPYAPRPSTSLPSLIVCATLLHAIGANASTNDNIITDRPDFVESSNVVGPGKIQVEMSSAVERSRAAGTRERLTSTPTLIRAGISDTVEFRLETDGFLTLRTQAYGGTGGAVERGMADAAVGIKWHFADESGYAPSMGLLAHLDLPSGARKFRSAGVQPSLRLAAEWELPGEMSFGVMPGISTIRAEQGRRYVAGIFGAVLGKSWSDRFRTFAEISLPVIARGVNGGTEAALDIGCAYLLSSQVQADFALSRGLNRNTFDTSLTLGLSFKY